MGHVLGDVFAFNILGNEFLHVVLVSRLPEAALCRFAVIKRLQSQVTPDVIMLYLRLGNNIWKWKLGGNCQSRIHPRPAVSFPPTRLCFN